jgi:hypothetical protein
MYHSRSLAPMKYDSCKPYFTFMEWADRLDVPIFLHEADREWVMRPSKRITF